MSFDLSRRARMLSRNDPLLHRLIEADCDAQRQAAIERLLVDVAAPTIRKVLLHFGRSERGLQVADGEDVTSIVTLRLVQKLRQCAHGEDDAIQSLADYVAGQTFNAIHDLFRSRFPARARLRNRIRYALAHDGRLAAWNSAATTAVGIAKFVQTAPSLEDIEVTPSPAMLARDRPADALYAVLSACDEAVTLDALVRKMAELWSVTDESPRADATLTLADTQPTAHDRIETRQQLAHAWKEVRELRAPQRAALLLNLRDTDGSNGIVELLVANIASFGEIAEAVGVTPEALAGLWPSLPLDDRTIGEMLGLTRQQVINLRQAARDRLSRRTAFSRRR